MVSSGVIPLAVLCGCLLAGGVASILLTRRIAQMQVVRDMERAAQAEAEAERVERDKPSLVDVYIRPPRRDLVLDRDSGGGGGILWPAVLVRVPTNPLTPPRSTLTVPFKSSAIGCTAEQQFVLSASAPDGREAGGVRQVLARGRERARGGGGDRDAQAVLAG